MFCRNYAPQIGSSMSKSCFFFLTILAFGCDTGTYRQGKFLYETQCGNCHMPDGSGLAGLIPPMVNNPNLAINRAKLPCIIVHGMKDEIIVNGTFYNQEMVGNSKLTESEIANILNFIFSEWNEGGKFFSPEEVMESLKNCEEN